MSICSRPLFRVTMVAVVVALVAAAAPPASAGPLVQPFAAPTLTAVLDRDAVRVGRPVVVSGTVAPAEAGARLELEQRAAGRWRRVDVTTTDVAGGYRLSAAPAQPGFWSLRVVRAGGQAPGDQVELPAVDVFRLHRYSVTTRGVVRADLDEFRAQVAAVFADSRGWARAQHRFREVEASGGRGAMTVVLSQARYLPTYSSVCSTTYSCRVGRYVIINQDRWRGGSPYFPGTIEQYRRMLVNHETGHWLGRGHAYCPGRGRPAPVMQQQSKGLDGCRVNPWPLSREVDAVS